jgi:GT2 family glycosyltransferase
MRRNSLQGAAMDRKVSFIIVSHDLRDYLLRCITKIIEHTDRDLVEEIVVVDNGSRQEVGKEELTGVTFFPLSLVRLEKNSSYSSANNRGVEASRGSYVCFMNNDVEVLPGWLPPLYGTLDADRRIGAVGPKMIFQDGTIQFAGYEKDQRTKFQKHRFRKVKTEHTVSEANVPGPVPTLTGACIILRRDDAHFDERYWYGCEDVDLCVTLKQHNKVIFYQPASVIIHHEERSRSSGMVPIDYEQNRMRFKKKWGPEWEHLLWKVVE